MAVLTHEKLRARKKKYKLAGCTLYVLAIRAGCKLYVYALAAHCMCSQRVLHIVCAARYTHIYPQIYTSQEGIEEIKNNPQVYTTQEGIEEIKNKPQVYTT